MSELTDGEFIDVLRLMMSVRNENGCAELSDGDAVALRAAHTAALDEASERIHAFEAGEREKLQCHDPGCRKHHYLEPGDKPDAGQGEAQAMSDTKCPRCKTEGCPATGKWTDARYLLADIACSLRARATTEEGLIGLCPHGNLLCFYCWRDAGFPRGGS